MYKYIRNIKRWREKREGTNKRLRSVADRQAIILFIKSLASKEFSRKFNLSLI